MRSAMRLPQSGDPDGHRGGSDVWSLLIVDKCQELPSILAAQQLAAQRLHRCHSRHGTVGSRQSQGGGFVLECSHDLRGDCVHAWGDGPRGADFSGRLAPSRFQAMPGPNRAIHAASGRSALWHLALLDGQSHMSQRRSVVAQPRWYGPARPVSRPMLPYQRAGVATCAVKKGPAETGPSLGTRRKSQLEGIRSGAACYPTKISSKKLRIAAHDRRSALAS